MNIQVSGRKVSVTPALRTHAEEKLQEAVKVFSVEPMSADVVLRVKHYKGEKTSERCEITLRVKGYVIRVECAKEDMYAAIDEACRMVSRQLRKYKTKVIDKKARKKGSYEDIAAQQQALEDQVLADEAELADDDLLVRTKYIDYSVMDEEHALVQTDLLGHDFYVFKDADTKNVHVVYKRKNGGYGIIKPIEEDPEA